MDNGAYVWHDFDDLEGVKRNETTELDGSFEKSMSRRSTLAQFIATFIISLSAITVGFLYAIPAIVIKSVYDAENELSLTDEQVSWYGSLIPIAQPLGCFLGGYLQRYFGRVRGLVFTNVWMLTSWIVLYTASNAYMLYLTSVLMGMAVGFTEAPAIMYVAEITTPSLRGMFVSYLLGSCTAGIALTFFLTLFMSWRTLCIFVICLCVLTILALAMTPESPVWCINMGKEKEALTALQWLRGWVTEEQVKQEFESIRQQIKNSVKQNLIDGDGESSWKQKLNVDELTRASTLRPFILVVVYYFFACAAMVMGARNYILLICDRLNIPMSPTSLVLLNSIAAVLGNIFSGFLMRILGKRTLSLSSMLITSVACVSMGLHISFQHEINLPHSGQNRCSSWPKIIR